MEINDLCKRHMLLIAVSLLIGIYIVSGENKLFGAVSSFLFLLSVNLYCKRKIFIIVILIMFLSAFYAWFLSCNYDRDYSLYDHQKLKISGIVTDIIRIEKERTIINVKPNGLFSNKVRLNIYENNPDIELGMRIIAEGIAQKPTKRTNPGGFDERKYFYSSNITVKINIYEKGYYLEEELNIRRIFGKVYHFLKNRYEQYLGTEDGNILSGMIIGAKEEVSGDTIENYQKSGLSHAMAVSGSHVSYLLMPFIIMFSFSGLERKRYYWIIFMVLAFFMLLTGLKPSVIRAGITWAVILASRLINKEPDPLSSLSFSAFVLMVINPFCIYDLGFILSYTSVISILFFYQPLLEKLKFKGIIAKVFALNIAVAIGSAIASAKLFYVYNTYSVIANMTVFFIRMILSVGGYAMAILGSIFNPLGVILSYPVRVLLSIINMTAKVYSTLPLSTISIKYISPFTVLLFFLALYLFLIYNKKVLCMVAMLMMIISVSITQLNINSFKLVFYDVGQGDSSLIKAGYGKDILIDTGKYTPLSSVSHFTGHVIDAVFITHSHLDHIGGLLDITERFSIKNVYFPDIEDNKLLETMELLIKKNINIHKVKKGDEIVIGKAIVRIFSPDEFFKGTLNNTSIVLKISYDGFTALYTGDIEREAEQNMLCKELDLSSHILKVPHHGSDTSSTLEFIKSVNPHAGIISTGYNKYGHPSDKVIKRYESNGTAIFRTDMNGCIIISPLKKRISIRTFGK